LGDEIARDAEPDAIDSYTQAAPLDQLYAGLERYWRKRSEKDQGSPVS
jgi:hypothetical protein